MDERAICANCKWCKRESMQDYGCYCEESDNYGCDCCFDDTCSEFEEKED